VTERAKLYVIDPMKSLIVEGLSKRYTVPKPQATKPTETRMDRLRSFFSVPLARDMMGGQDVWALRDMSFDVEGGTVLGVIGSNGAGKTTLLKVIAKVIEPTAGRVLGRGRVVSLLELGAGFDDEATARENIFMNAAINGIPRSVALERMDNIIEFAEMQEFIDTPLQYFSSGMYLRLAFSVAINMQPSILLADEILAVGDMAFQERCLQRVRELARDEGLTVLFVSHDMEAVSRICDRVIWVKDGTLHRAGEPEDVVTEYQNATWELLTSAEKPEAKGSSHAGRYGEILEVKLLSSDGREIGSPPRSEDIYVRIRFRTYRARSRARCAFDLFSKGVLVLRSAQPEMVAVGPDEAYEAVARIPANLLSETTYTISVGVTLIRGEGEEHALVVNKALAFMVYREEAGEGSTTLHRTGLIDPTLEWSMEMKPYAIRA
jgi:lipopolysaccharide transport system ATP-binding protein